MLARVQLTRLCSSVAAAALLAATGCAVRRTTRVAASAPNPPLRQASAAELVARINAQSGAVRTMTATVDLEPTTGSVYSGVIKEYRDVRGFILFQSPDFLRMVGQAPVVRTTLFDMVSNGSEFKLSIPPKGKFIVGSTRVERPAKNALENLRPQHILDALDLPPVNSEREKYFVEQELEGERGQASFVVTVLEPANDGQLTLKRKVSLDGATLEVSRLQLFGPGGEALEDVHYSAYQDFAGVHYPARIELSRPVEDYRLGINIEKATFNQPIAPEKFQLEKPPAAQLIELSEAEPAARPRAEVAIGQ